MTKTAEELPPLTDAGNAQRMVARHGRSFRFVAAWGKWLTWDGARWVPDEGDVHMQAFAKDTARSIYREASATEDESRRKAVASWAAKSESRARIEAMIALTKSEPRIAVSHDGLDADDFTLNAANGTIDLRTGELRPHNRDDLLTKISPVTYDAAAEAPTWRAFLRRAMADRQELVDYLARIVGYALTGSIREHVLAFLFGEGANGKSTFLETVRAALGDYARPAPRGMLFRSRGERHPTELAVLHGARFVTCPEIEEGVAFDEALVKDLTGGDAIAARRMREDFWSFRPTHKLFLAGNHKPIVRGDDEGIWRRMRLVPWTVTIPEGERDKLLPEKLRAELPGVLRWAVEGCIAWQRDGLGDPVEVTKATAAYREESDPLAEFLARRCVLTSGAKMARKDLRAAYTDWCDENGAQPLGARRFAEGLRRRGVVDGNTVRQGSKMLDAWAGIRLRSDSEEPGGSRVGDRDQEGSSFPITVECAATRANINSTPYEVPSPCDEVGERHGGDDDPELFSTWLSEKGVGVQ